MEEPIVFEHQGGIDVVTLSRLKALNPLTLGKPSLSSSPWMRGSP
ncbi:MAG TPA: hypothetical protein VII08_02730 [Myxococcales bacterium]